MRLIRHKKGSKAGLEFVSIHIQKTAGRSFRDILSQVYGPLLDERYEKHHFFIKNKKVTSIGIKVPENIIGMHGHLTIGQVKELIKHYDPKVITWVRNPVDRVISNYYFLMKRIRFGNTTEKVQLRKEMTLLEYAQKPRNINRMSKIISGLEISDFFFIGIMERFEADVEILAKRMNWPEDVNIPFSNSNADFRNSNACTTRYDDIDESMRKSISDLNMEDIKLYNEVLKMRGISLDHDSN